MKDNEKKEIANPQSEVDAFPYEQFDLGRTEDLKWLKNRAIDTSITGIVFADLKGVIFYANEAAVRIWQYTDPSDYINRSAGKFSQSKEKSMEVFHTAMSEGVWIGEIGGIRKDDTLNHLYLQANLVRNNENIPVCLMYSFMDITEKKELEAQMLIKNIAIEKSITGIILLDLKGRVAYVNEATAAIWGDEKSLILGKYAAEFAQSWEEMVDIFNIVQKKGFWRGEFVGKRKDGSINVVHLSASLIRDVSDEPACVMCSFVDVTEQKQMQEQLKKLIAELQSSLSEIKALQGILPICSYCKKIRDDKGYWNQIEAYIQDHSEAEFSHSICQECAKERFPDMDIYDE